MHILVMPPLGFSPAKQSQKDPEIKAGFVGPEMYTIWRSFFNEKEKNKPLFCKSYKNKCTC